MFDESRMTAYLEAFNARDYDAVLDFYIDDPEIRFAGMVLRGRQAIRAFYTFFHSFVDETIVVDSIACGADLLAMEARVRLTAKRALTPANLAENGFPQLLPLEEGATVEMQQFIHYRVAGDRLVRATCLINDQVGTTA